MVKKEKKKKKKKKICKKRIKIGYYLKFHTVASSVRGVGLDKFHVKKGLF